MKSQQGGGVTNSRWQFQAHAVTTVVSNVCCRMTVILKEESITLYKDKNTFTAVVFIPGSYTAFGQVSVYDSPNLSL